MGPNDGWPSLTCDVGVGVSLVGDQPVAVTCLMSTFVSIAKSTESGRQRNASRGAAPRVLLEGSSHTNFHGRCSFALPTEVQGGQLRSTAKPETASTTV